MGTAGSPDTYDNISAGLDAAIAGAGSSQTGGRGGGGGGFGGYGNDDGSPSNDGPGIW